jgi:hypothetical protein
MQIAAQDAKPGMVVTKANLGIVKLTVSAVNANVKGYTGRRGTELVFTNGESVVVYQNKLTVDDSE